MKDLLLEIGTEEIPARFVPMALEALHANAQDRLGKAGVAVGALRVFGTPRRLALVGERLAEKAQDQQQEYLGPSVAQAKDGEGNWTPAAQGFARSQATTPEVLEVRETDRGPRLAFVKKTPGAPTAKLLPTLLPELVRSLSFPKSMVWEPSRFVFARPIRWVLALYGTAPVPFSLAGVKAGRTTQGLRFQSRKPLAIQAPDRYVSVLKNHCVIVDPAERRHLILQQIHHVAKAHHGYIPVEKWGDLLEEVTHLVEHPVAVVGKFDPRYLAVPKEVLITSMKKHQKYFPVFRDASCEDLLPYFVAIRNGLSENLAVVREGYERVLSARLADASFFFDEHRTRPLSARVEDLRGVAFLSSTLTLADKTRRVERLVDVLAGSDSGIDPDTVLTARRIATLAKADLTTGLVGEFPELQGVVGRLYAEREGEPPAVSRGIEEHHWPLTAEGPLPTDAAAALVSLADKVDTLAGNFLQGKVPSGSQDPYGLRRAAVGVLRLLEKRGGSLRLSNLLDQAMGLLPESLGARSEASSALRDFFRQRWAALAEARGFRPDEVEAVAAEGLENVGDAWARLTALRDIRRHPDFIPLSIAFKRASHLLKQAEKKGEVIPIQTQENLFQLGAERELATALSGLESALPPLLVGRDYAGALARLVSLRAPVDQFFAGVVVMDSNPSLRQARLSLLGRVRTLFASVADFSRLQDTP